MFEAGCAFTKRHSPSQVRLCMKDLSSCNLHDGTLVIIIIIIIIIMIPAIGPQTALFFVLAVFVLAIFVLAIFVLRIFVLAGFVLAVFVLAVFVLRISVLAVFVLADFVLAVFHFAGQRDNGGATGFGGQSQIPYVFPFGTNSIGTKSAWSRLSG